MGETSRPLAIRNQTEAGHRYLVPNLDDREVRLKGASRATASRGKARLIA